MPQKLHGSTRRVCRSLRLCPRPLPRSLRGVSLEALSTLSWFAQRELGVKSEHVALVRERLSREPGSCGFCGAPAHGFAEVWEYEVRDGKGYAVLVDVKPACRRCLAALRVEGSRAAIAERLSRVNGISIAEAEAVLAAAVRLAEAASRVNDWSLIVEVEGLEHVGESLQRLYDRLKAYDARLRNGWLVKGVGGTACPAPVDPGLLVDAVRAVGGDISPSLLVSPPPYGIEARIKWVSMVPSAVANVALKKVLEFTPVYVEISMLVTGEQASIPIEITLPCYDQLAYHEEALRLLKSVSAAIGSGTEAVLVAEAGNQLYELARTRVPPS